MTILIIGAGMAGLVAANMLRRHAVTIWEKAPALPQNHTAVLRFRTTAVSDATGIPFTKEVVRKGLWKDGKVVNEPTLEDLNRYSLMVTGGNIFNRSIFNLSQQERWCAPRDFIAQMAKNLDIKYNRAFEKGKTGSQLRIISTVPMPFMMDMFGWRDKPEFKWLPVFTIKVELLLPIVRVCQTLYQTQDPYSWYRATLHSQELTLEFMLQPNEKDVTNLIVGALKAFGFGCEFVYGSDGAIKAYTMERGFSFIAPTLNTIPIGKILPIDERTRKRFMLWLTEKHGIYSLGRFACWRNILLDDVVSDVKKIEQLIEKGHTYDER